MIARPANEGLRSFLEWGLASWPAIVWLALWLNGCPTQLNYTVRIILPQEAAEQTASHSQAWAWGRNAAGQEVTLWLTTGDGYAFTAASSVLAMERILDGSLVGVLPPAAAFGADFALAVPHTQRFTSLEEIGQATLSQGVL